MAGLAAPPDAADAVQMRKAAAGIARDLGVQQKLPNDAEGAEPGSTGASQTWFPGAPEGPEVNVPAEIWGIVRWAIIGIVVVAAAAWLGTWFMETWRRPQVAAIPGAGPRAGEHERAAPFDPAEALTLADQWAAAGRYGDAMHQVLLAAMAVLGPRLAHAAPDSLTSWELLRAANLHAGERQALRNVVMRVDRAWFGERPAALEDYQAVRGSYQAFASAAESATA